MVEPEPYGVAYAHLPVNAAENTAREHAIMATMCRSCRCQERNYIEIRLLLGCIAAATNAAAPPTAGCAWTSPPTRVPANGTVGGPLLGNGNVGVVMMGGGGRHAGVERTADWGGSAVPVRSVHSKQHVRAEAAQRQRVG